MVVCVYWASWRCVAGFTCWWTQGSNEALCVALTQCSVKSKVRVFVSKETLLLCFGLFFDITACWPSWNHKLLSWDHFAPPGCINWQVDRLRQGPLRRVRVGGQAGVWAGVCSPSAPLLCDYTTGSRLNMRTPALSAACVKAYLFWKGVSVFSSSCSM